jgi:hypothetical protein
MSFQLASRRIRRDAGLLVPESRSLAAWSTAVVWSQSKSSIPELSVQFEVGRSGVVRGGYGVPEIRCEDQSSSSLTSFAGLVIFQKPFSRLALKRRLRVVRPRLPKKRPRRRPLWHGLRPLWHGFRTVPPWRPKVSSPLTSTKARARRRSGDLAASADRGSPWFWRPSVGPGAASGDPRTARGAPCRTAVRKGQPDVQLVGACRESVMGQAVWRRGGNLPPNAHVEAACREGCLDFSITSR